MKSHTSPLFRNGGGGSAAFVRFVLAFVLLVSAGRISAADKDELKVLMIGNSFSDYPTVYLPAMAKAGGKVLILGHATIGGCTLEKHAGFLRDAEAGKPTGAAYNTADPRTHQKRKMSLPEMLGSEQWDIVTLHQSSSGSYKPDSFQPYADEIIAAIHKYAPTARIMMQETWAYRSDHLAFSAGDGFTPAAMYTTVRNTYHTFADAKGFGIIPTGDAMDLARQTPRWTYVPDPAFDFKNPPAGQLPDQHASLNIGWVWTKDKAGKAILFNDAAHTNTAGKYLGAATWYQVLFNTDDVPATYLPEGLAAEDAADLRTYARAAVLAERARKAPQSVAK